jgi:hypothetical protein
MDEDDLDDLETEPPPPDPVSVLAAVAECLRHLACGYGLVPAEREACLALLQGPLPGVLPTDREAARKILTQAGRRRLADRTRDRASALAVRLAPPSAADP